MPTSTKKSQDLAPGDRVRIYGTDYVVNDDGVLPGRVGKVIIHTTAGLFRADVDQEFVVMEEG